MAEVKGISVYREETNPGTPAGDSLYLVKAAGEAFAKLLATNNDGTIIAALVGTRPRGAYDAGTAYTLGDEVTYEGSTWLCLQSTTGNAPPSLPTTSNSYWTLRASKGDTGINYYNPGPVTEAVASGDITEGGWYIDYSAATAVNITKVRAVAFNSSGGEGSFVLRLKDQDNTVIYGPTTVEFGTELDADVDLDWSEGDAILAEINAVDDVQSYLVQVNGTQS